MAARRNTGRVVRSVGEIPVQNWCPVYWLAPFSAVPPVRAWPARAPPHGHAASVGAVCVSPVCGQFHVRSPNLCDQISGHPAKRDGPTGWVCLAGCGGWSKPGQRFEHPVKTKSPTGWPDIGGAVVLYWGCHIFFPISFPFFRCFVICHGPLRTDSARPFALGVHVFLPGRWLVRPSFSPAAPWRRRTIRRP